MFRNISPAMRNHIKYLSTLAVVGILIIAMGLYANYKMFRLVETVENIGRYVIKPNKVCCY